MRPIGDVANQTRLRRNLVGQCGADKLVTDLGIATGRGIEEGLSDVG